MEFSELELERLKKLQRLRERGIEPYPARVTRTHTNQQAIDELSLYGYDNVGEHHDLLGYLENYRPTWATGAK